MKKKFKRAVAGFIAGLMTLSTVVSLVTPAFADDDIIVKDGFTFEKIAEQNSVKYYKITGYSGNSRNVVIPDTVGSQTSVVVDIGTNVFDGHNEIQTLKIGKYMTRGNEEVFDALKNVSDYEVAEGNTKYSADDGVLYRETTLLAYPKAKLGSYTIKDGTTQIGNRAFFETDIETLTIPDTVTINNQYDADAGIYKYSFLGANVNMYNYAGDTSGAIIIGNRLVAYGEDSHADLSGIATANPYAFVTEDKLDEVRDTIPEAVLKSVPFSFYSGEIDGLCTSYFNIDGKSAYCYDHGKLNPETVGNLSDYDNLISTDAIRHTVKAILFAGYPNDAYGLLASTGVAEEAAKNITGSLIWDSVNGVNFNLDDIYGIVDRNAAQKYAEAIQNKIVDITDETMANFELKFYHGNANTQSLVVISQVATPIKPSISFEKKDADTRLAVAGATLRLTKTDDFNRIVDEWETDGTPHMVAEIDDGEYTLSEEEAPDGYEVADPISFVVKDALTAVTSITMYDKKIEPPAIQPISMTFEKVDADTNAPLPGARLKLMKGDTKIDEWVTDGTPHVVNDLTDGEYTLVEVSAPNKYDIANPIVFTIENGATDKTTITMSDKKTPVDQYLEIQKLDLTTKREVVGAKLQLLRDGEEVDVWTSSNASHKIKNPADGEYELIEVTAPDGYEVAESITFSIVNGVLPAEKIIMYDEKTPEPNTTMISKVDATTGAELPGAKLTLTLNGTVIDTWTSTTAPHKVILPEDGTYTLTEVTAPDGYEVAEDIDFDVVDGAVVNGPIVMKDERTKEPAKVKISKIDAATVKELPGAKLTLTFEDGTTVDEWVSGTTPHEVILNKDGEYTLTEVTAPNGYEVAENITFKVTNGTVASDKIVMKDQPKKPTHVEPEKPATTTVKISKIDAATTNELPGAKLKLAFEDGTTIDEWTSGTTPYEVTLNKDGEYTLTEITAPDGYELAESITFKVTNGKVDSDKITMIDKPKKPDEPSKPDKPVTPVTPATPSNPTKPSKPSKGPSGHYSGRTTVITNNTPTTPVETPVTPVTPVEPTPEPTPVTPVVPDEPRIPVKTGDFLGTAEMMFVALAAAGMLYLIHKKKED